MHNEIGTIYGVLLNDRVSMARLSEQFTTDPYKAAPRAPILYIKPANTICSNGSVVLVPRTPGRVQIGATIGAVVGQRATRVSRDNALSFVAGYRVVADVSLPHENFYRPAIRERCRDGFCPVGALIKPDNFDANKAEIMLSINGKPTETRSLIDAVRPVDQLLTDVTEFMTLEVGDMLLLGLSDHPPVANAGDEIKLSIAGLGTLDFRIALENAMAAA